MIHLFWYRSKVTKGEGMVKNEISIPVQVAAPVSIHFLPPSFPILPTPGSTAPLPPLLKVAGSRSMTFVLLLFLVVLPK